MKIEDDFLEQKNFDTLRTIMMGSNLAWFFNDCIVSKDDILRFQFTHSFFLDCNRNSEYFPILNPILSKIQPISIWRIKTNLLTKTPNIVKNQFHIDMEFIISEEKLKQWTTSIFYINTNNGYTEFQDGRIAMENTKVKSVANRLVTFPANLRHRGTSCTDEKTRVVINFNYFK